MPVLHGKPAWEAYLAYLQAHGHVCQEILPPEEIEEMEFDTTPVEIKVITVDWARVLVHVNIAPSMTAAMRLIKQNALSVDGHKVTERYTQEIDGEFELRCGRKMLKLVLV
jgi:tyrosyl-tRNA synthetase